jgi:ubiquinone/menaquinone biosynthesis C-methylase UbiE
MGTDRVSELYRGEVWSHREQQTCRDRIHWMCAHVAGERVLDIGCSQGIASLLLGQEGHKVIGVDIDPEVIEFAQRELATRPDAIKENVEFRLISPEGLPFDDASFDSVLLGEVIEHLNRPERMLAETRRVLKPGGTVVITTPFGLHPDPGHVRTFYLSSFAKLLSGFFQAGDLCILQKYICYAGVAGEPQRGEAEALTMETRLLELSEAAFQRAELGYHETLEAQKAKCASLEKQVGQLRSSAEEQRKQLGEVSRRARLAQTWHSGTVRLAERFRALLKNDGVGIDVSHLVKRTEQVCADLSKQPESAHQLDLLARLVEDLQHLLEKELLSAKRALELSRQQREADSARLRREHQLELERQRRQLEERRLDTLARAEHDRQQAVRREQTAAARKLAAAEERWKGAQQKQAAELRQAQTARAKAEQQVRALQARTSRQADLLEYRQAELALKQQEVRYRLGDALVRAATNPLDFIKLPGRLVRLYFAGLKRQGDRKRLAAERPATAATPVGTGPKPEASPEDTGPPTNRYGVVVAEAHERAGAVRRHRRLQEDFERFVEEIRQGDASHVVVMFGGTTHIQDVRANRPIRLTQALARMNIPVLFNFHRWRETDHIPPYLGGLIFQSPTDRTPEMIDELLTCDLKQTRRILIVSYPHPATCRLVNVANANGWVTIYDCRDDWEEFHKVRMAKWYDPAVERFILNNCDLTCCVSRPLQAKLRRLNDRRPVRLSPNAYDPAFVDGQHQRRPSAELKVGYFGHLSESWFDWDALQWISRRRPTYRFEIIGHSAPKKLKLPSNVVLLGPKRPPEICRLAAEWRVGMIPFRVGPLADGVDPIKIYEYFGLGLPVVSFRMPQIADYPYTTTVDTKEAFVTALDRALRESPKPEVFREFLQNNTWDVRAREMLRWADEVCDDIPCEKTFHVSQRT